MSSTNFPYNRLPKRAPLEKLFISTLSTISVNTHQELYFNAKSNHMYHQYKRTFLEDLNTWLSKGIKNLKGKDRRKMRRLCEVLADFNPFNIKSEY